MKAKIFFKRFFFTFAIALIVNVCITLLWNYFIKKYGLIIDWDISIKMALVLAIIIPLSMAGIKKQ